MEIKSAEMQRSILESNLQNFSSEHCGAARKIYHKFRASSCGSQRDFLLYLCILLLFFSVIQDLHGAIFR